MDTLEDLEAAAFDSLPEEPPLEQASLAYASNSFPNEEVESTAPVAQFLFDEEDPAEIFDGTSAAGATPHAAGAALTALGQAPTAPAVPAGSVLSSSEYAQALASAVDRCSKKPRLSLPWESESLAGIFSQDLQSTLLNAPAFERGVVPEHFATAAVAPSIPAAPSATQHGTLRKHSSCAQLVKARPDKSFVQSDDDKRSKALFMWAEFLSPVLEHCQFGRLILCDSSDDSKASKILFNLNAVFGRKASSTIYSRALAAVRYQQFCASRQELPFPMNESLCWTFVNNLVQGKPTAASSFLRLVNFMHFTLGPDGSDEVRTSARLSGRAALALNNKAPTKQAPPFSVAMVRTLHGILGDATRPSFDRLAAGTFLCAIYGRCRWSDMRHIHSIVLDVVSERRHGFIEILTKHHKTAKRESGKLLPIVAPAYGITGDCWALSFVELRNQLLHDRAAEPGPVLPAISSEEPLVFLQRPLETDEATAFLHFLLDKYPGIECWTSHSCKETPLSWLAKAGADKPTLDFMGRHVGSITSSDIYARGMQSRPLRKFVLTIKMIHVGTFDPDATRSGMFLDHKSRAFAPTGVRSDSPLTAGPGTPPSPLRTTDDNSPAASPAPRTPLTASEAEQDQAQVEEDRPRDTQASSEASDSSESSSSSSSSSVVQPQVALPAARPAQAQAFAHPKGKVHLQAKPGSTRFKCGRAITDVFSPVGADAYMRSALCSQCEPAAFPIRTTSDMLAALDAILQRPGPEA